MDSTTILVASIAVLSAVLVIVGIYSVFVLRDLRRTLDKVNRILGRIDSITEHVDTNIVRPATSLAGILAVLRDGVKVVNEIKHLSTDTSQTAKVVSSEAKEIAEAVKEELIPAAVEGAKEVTEEVWKDAKDVIAETKGATKEVAHDVAEETKEVISEAKKPEPMRAGSLAPRRRFFSKRR